MKLALFFIVGAPLAWWLGAVAGTWLGKKVFRWLEPDAPHEWIEMVEARKPAKKENRDVG